MNRKHLIYPKKKEMVDSSEKAASWERELPWNCTAEPGQARSAAEKNMFVRGGPKGSLWNAGEANDKPATRAPNGM
jgi:hypothetical protein